MENKVDISGPRVHAQSVLDYFQNTFIPRYNDLVDIVDKKASTCLEMIRFLEPLVENEKTYSQSLEKILAHRMSGSLSFEESGVYEAWGAFKSWMIALQQYSSRSYTELKTAKEEFAKFYSSFDTERKKFYEFLSSKHKELNDFSKKLCKTRDKYYKLCREELPKADADYGKVENEKKLYEAQVRITNKYFSQFYTRDLPSELRAMEEGLVRRVFSIQETLKKLVLVKKISNEKIAALNDDVLAYLDEVDSLSELDELLKKYNPENTPFIYSDICEFQEYKAHEGTKQPPHMYLIPQVDPSTLCQVGRSGSGFRGRTNSDPETELSVNFFSGVNSSVAISADGSPASPQNTPIVGAFGNNNISNSFNSGGGNGSIVGSGGVGVVGGGVGVGPNNLSNSVSIGSSGNGSIVGINGYNNNNIGGGGGGSWSVSNSNSNSINSINSNSISSTGSFKERKSKKKSIMGFRLHKKGNNDFSASDSDSVLTTPARFQVAADAAAAAQERSWFKAHKNSVDSSAGGCGGYRGSTGRQGHSSVDLTDKLSMSYTLFSSSASTLPMAPGSGYSAGSSSSSSALSGSPDPFAYSNGVQPNAISLGQQQQQQQQQQQPTLPPQAGLGSSPARLPSFSVLTRPASVAAIPHVSPPIAVPSSIALGTSGGGGGGGGGSGSAAAAAAVIALSGDKRPTKLFGTPLGCLPMGSGKQTPKVLRFFLKNMVKTNVAGTPNVFKRGGKAPLIAAFKKELDSGTFNYNTDPYVSADVFKLWIRSLPEPLVPKSLYEEAIKCCTDDESFAVFSKIEEPSKATLACIICFLKYMCSCEEKTKVNETALAGIFSSCIMKCPYTDMKMMISATEKQTSFTLGLLDAVGSKLIVSKDFEKIVKKDDKTPEKVSEPQLSTNSNNEKKNRTESIENITVKPAEAKEKKKVSAKKPGDLPKSEAIVLPRTPRTPCIKVFGDGDVDAYNMEADVDKDDVTELEFFIDEKRRTVVTSDSENEGDEDPFDNGDGTPLSSPPPPVQQQQQQQKKKKPTQSHPHKQSESKKKSRSKRETSKISKPSEK